ncbi:MAG: hypothetical protein SFX18_16215 [Pirellulales bacterium]|nr:hypothetical protein [Pirellulales bacterium]
MSLKSLGWLLLAALLAVAGYFFFGIVVAIYVSVILTNDKMTFAQGVWAHVFGGAGALCGLAMAWLLHKLLSVRDMTT